MRINNKDYTRAELLERVGNVTQLGGTRHYTLADGRAKGVAAVDFDTGAGLRFTVLPDRAMDISTASYKGLNLVHKTANGEVNPSFYDAQGAEWLRTFFAGLLTTCGLRNLGGSCEDNGEGLGVHGRQSATPASQVRDTSGWRGDEYVMELTGVTEDCVLFGDKLRLTRTITSKLGDRMLVIRDTVENFGYASSPFVILYHINPGFPLLDAGSRLKLSAIQSSASNERSRTAMPDMFSFTAPIPGFQEQNFLHTMGADSDGSAYVSFANPELAGGLGLYIRYDARALPYCSEWRMMGRGDYVVGLEPCNCPCECRATLRERDQLPFIEPGEVKEIEVEIGVLDGPDDIAAFEKGIDYVLEGGK